MADQQDPLRRLIDIAVYAPIGLALLAQKELPALTAAGKERVDNQITLARFIGKIALTRGRQELQRRLDAAEAARDARVRSTVEATASEVTETVAGADVSATSNGAGDLPDPATATSLPEVLLAAVAESPALADTAPLPIDGYDSLAASQVVVRLATLTDEELTQIHDHEVSHRARRTILGKISQLQAR